MSKYVIEYGIPIPPRKPGPGRKKDENSLLGKVRQLEIGGSVWAEKPGDRLTATGSTCRKKFPDRRFIVRTEGNGARIWRIK